MAIHQIFARIQILTKIRHKKGINPRIADSWDFFVETLKKLSINYRCSDSCVIQQLQNSRANEDEKFGGLPTLFSTIRKILEM